MALTVRKLYGKDAKALTRTPNQSIQVISVDFDNSYPTGGEALTYDQPIAEVWWIGGGTHIFEYDKAAGKIKAFTLAGTTPNIVKAEAANGADLSAQTGIKFAVLVDHNA